MSAFRGTYWPAVLGALFALAAGAGVVAWLGPFSRSDYDDALAAELVPPVPAERLEDVRTQSPTRPEPRERHERDDGPRTEKPEVRRGASKRRGITAVAEALRRSHVQIGFKLKYDAGEPPCSLAGSSASLEAMLLEESCPARGGWLLDERTVYSPDIQIHPRFIETIWAGLPGGATTYARVTSYLRDADGMILELDHPLWSARPLSFSRSVAGPYYAVSYFSRECRWRLRVRRTFDEFHLFHDGPTMAYVGAHSLVVGADATPIGFCTMDEVPLEGSWMSSPLDWPRITARDYEYAQDSLSGKVAAGLPRVHLRFRSPKKSAEEPPPYAFLLRDEDDAGPTTLDATGLVIDRRRLLVLAELAPELTARLEAIEVHVDGRVIGAEHLWSLKDYGAFLVRTTESLEGALVRREIEPEAMLDRLLLTASVVQRAERCDARFGHMRVDELTIGRGGLAYPDVPAEVHDHYLFTPEGELVALALQTRAHEPRPRWKDPEAVMVPVLHLRGILADPRRYSDPGNAPRPVEGERRLAWLGVEVQPLDRRLARANDAAHLTKDGDIGALVSYVYPDSPASRIGLETGDILLRLRSSRRPKPFDVAASGQDEKDYEDWLDEYDDLLRARPGRTPRRPPWPSVENGLNRDLTTIGIGQVVTLEYMSRGEVKTRRLTVVEGPPHFEAAPHHEAAALGLTVRDLTYEVRRHYQLDRDAPGVVVIEVEKGSPADVADVAKYEIISAVRGEPVTDIAAFARATDAGDDTLLTVRGVARERVVKIRAP
jgi:hypothetical protein